MSQSTRNIIVIEGPDGVGKSRLAEELALLMCNAGIETVRLREPGGTPLGEYLRKAAKYPEDIVGHSISVKEELMLMYTGRISVLEYIRDNPKTMFILDRHDWTSLAYQGVMGGELELAKSLTDMLIQPDEYYATILLDADSETIVRRRIGRGLKTAASDALEAKYAVDMDRNRKAYQDTKHLAMRGVHQIEWFYPRGMAASDAAKEIFDILTKSKES